MKKIVKTIFSNDNRVRRTRDFNIEIYSHDRNNAGFEFVIKNETDLSKYVPKFLFHFLDSRSYWETQGTIEGNKVSVKFDTELITRSEEVLGYLTLDSETDDIDAFKFRFNVVLSEIDKDSTVKKEFRFIKDSVVIDAVTTKELEDVKSKLVERITTLENKADNDTVYDDSDLQKRVKTLEDKPVVDIKNLATKETLEDYALKTEIPTTDTVVKKAVEEVEKKGYLTEHQSLTGYVTETQLEGKNYLTEHQDIKGLATKEELRKAFLDEEEHEKYAKKSEIPQPYNDTDVTTRLTALENRPAGSGGNVDEDIKNRVTALEDKFVKGDGETIDLKNLVTDEKLNYEFINRNTSAAIIQADKDIESFFLENTDSKDVDKIQVRGYVYSFAGETKIFKQKNGDDLEFVGFQGAMITLANVLPKDYDSYEFNDPEKRVTLLTDKNFKEMVATPEFKAVVKESLREIVKEIMREEN